MWPRALRLDGSVRDPMALHMLDAGAGAPARRRVRHAALPSRLLSVLGLFARSRRRSSPRCTAGSTCRSTSRCSTRSRSVPVVSISDAQRAPVPQARWVTTVHHGLPASLLAPQPVKPGYLAFLGRIAPEKAVDRAIRHRRPLRAAAQDRRQGGPGRRDYFERRHPSAARAAGRRVHRRDRRRAEVRLSQRRPCAARSRSTGPSRSAW